MRGITQVIDEHDRGTRIEIIGKISGIRTDDGGAAKVVTIGPDHETQIYPRLISWDDDCKHDEFPKLKTGQRVRVTFEFL